jgi:hypothetical protein
MMRKFNIHKFMVLAAILVLSAGFAQAQKRYRVGYKDEGLSFIAEGAALLPSNIYPTSFNANAILGAQLGAKIFVGGGVALDAYSSDIFLPVFADARYFFLEGVFSPYVMLDAGYALPVDADERLGGGMMLNPAFGLKYFMSRTVALTGSLGYRYQNMPFDQGLIDGLEVNKSYNVQSFSLRVGLQF